MLALYDKLWNVNGVYLTDHVLTSQLWDNSTVLLLLLNSAEASEDVDMLLMYKIEVEPLGNYSENERNIWYFSNIQLLF